MRLLLLLPEGLQGGRVPGMTGVWVDGHKLAAIGVRARKWVTYHGLALNVSAGAQYVVQAYQWTDGCKSSVQLWVWCRLETMVRCGSSCRVVIRTHQVWQLLAAVAHRHADLGPFSLITPCGISDKPVGSVKTALSLEQLSSANGSSASVSLDAVVKDPLITEYRYALLEALEDVFGLQLQPASQQQLQNLLTQGVGDGAATEPSVAALA